MAKTNPSETVHCPKCNARLYGKNLEAHMANVHGTGLKIQIKLKTLVVLVLGVGMLVLAVSAFAFQPRGASGTGTAGGSAAPAFSLADTQQTPRTLDGYKGKVLLLNTMAGTWCPLCKRQMPELAKLQQTYGSKGVEFLTVNLDPSETPQQTETYRQQYAQGLWPFAKDTDQIVVKYQIVDRTTTFVIDKQGNILARIAGVTPASGIAPALDRVISA